MILSKKLEVKMFSRIKSKQSKLLFKKFLPMHLWKHKVQSLKQERRVFGIFFKRKSSSNSKRLPIMIHMMINKKIIMKVNNNNPHNLILLIKSNPHIKSNLNNLIKSNLNNKNGNNNLLHKIIGDLWNQRFNINKLNLIFKMNRNDRNIWKLWRIILHRVLIFNRQFCKINVKRRQINLFNLGLVLLDNVKKI